MVRLVSHYENSLLSCDMYLITIIISHKTRGTWRWWLRNQPARPLKGDGMQRTSINPWPWSLQVGGYNQAEAVSGHTTHLYCAGQTAIDADGRAQFAGDLGAQLGLALDNLQAVLDGAGMTLANVVRLNIFTTDVDAFLAQLGVLHARLQGAAPPGTLLGIARLAYPELMVEIEATAVA
jgi:enamine deaminase RidA (YjgF/YER057c/UK114 family)